MWREISVRVEVVYVLGDLDANGDTTTDEG